MGNLEFTLLFFFVELRFFMLVSKIAIKQLMWCTSV